LHYLTIAEAAEAIQKHEVSPLELTRTFLERIDALDQQLNAFITVTAESALQEARAAEAAILRGDYQGPLHGIPIALKDLYATKGIRTTAHSRVLQAWVPDEDATAVVRLKQAGTVLLGKLAMHEFAFGGPSLKGPFPPARNPWNLDHLPGGSSSGSGTAVAAGLCMGSLGSDTGGSIRGPASLCGIVGLKPTYGRVSRYGVVPLSWSLDHCGPMTWTVRDTAIMLQAIAGYDPKDPASSKTSVPDFARALREDVKGTVVGVLRRDFFDPEQVHPETLAAVESALKLLEDLGAKTKAVDIPSLDYVGAAWNCITMSEAYAYHEANLKTQPQNYGEYILPRVRVGAFYSVADYLQAQRVRTLLQHEFAQVMNEVDVLITPTSLQPAERFDEFDPSSPLRRSFTRIFNFTGMPAISICCGFTASGLPIGLQIAGRAFDEAMVLRVAHTYERHSAWRQQRPSL
jgi:aspartyl-tRNA(Asn)/glutamyl-tRNA(Gln) amidotransferase subunit A